jgi:hypothetical protein
MFRSPLSCGVSVNLQAAEALLDGLPADLELAKAVECIGRAGVFTREGLADARRAILALRGDASPLPDQLSALAGEYRADGDTVEFTVTGPPRPVSGRGQPGRLPDRAGGVDQRAQARAGAASLTLEFAPGEITARVTNRLPAAGTGAFAGRHWRLARRT